MNVLDLTYPKALAYFMRNENYNTLGLPSYIDFTPILDFVSKKVGKDSFPDILNKVGGQKPSDFEGVNYKMLVNKDGKFAYRPLQLANPFLYYLLVREITRRGNWKTIKDRFIYFSDPHIEVSSIPVQKDNYDKSQLASTILNWWNNLEQRSIELSLSYRYMFVTDIANCYGSIYTHTIDWAIIGKDNAKKKKKDSLGHLIDTYIQGMQYGQTNGIPQGGALFDFIAEIVLGYADRLLADRLEACDITEYHMLRYRDDYRIFCNDKEDLEKIALELNSVLSELNFQMNASKTKLTDNIVEDAIKPDKLFYISNVPIYKRSRSQFTSFQKELFYILSMSKQYPNSGTVCRLMTNINRRLEVCKHFDENTQVLIAIATEIAMYSPKIYQPALAFISMLIEKIDSTEAKSELIRKVYEKLKRLPNIGHIQIWMQRLTYKQNRIEDEHPYSEQICKLVEGAKVQLWNNDWLDSKYLVGFPQNKICNAEIRDNMTPSIRGDEYDIFDY